MAQFFGLESGWDVGRLIEDSRDDEAGCGSVGHPISACLYPCDVGPRKLGIWPRSTQSCGGVGFYLAFGLVERGFEGIDGLDPVQLLVLVAEV